MTKRCHMPKPCDDCPFRRENGIRLYAERIVEIVGCVAPEDMQGGNFPCHKTVEHDARDRRSELECTGGLIFAYKQGLSSQGTRIAERLGLIDPALADQPWPEIFDDLDEMLGQAIDARRSRRRRQRKAFR